MIYAFAHYATTDGRRVQFTIEVAELERVRRSGFLESEALRGLAIELAPGSEAKITMTPRAARVMVDVLAMVGGDAAVSARMLATQLDGMVDELRASRAIDLLIHSPVEPVGRRHSFAARSRGRL